MSIWFFKRNNVRSGLIAPTNASFGVNALNAASTGTYNSAVGLSALFANTTGQNNTAIGSNTLINNQTGSNNTALGYNAYPIATNISNYMALGYNVGSGTSLSNMVEVGNTSVATIRGQVNFSTYSDARIKKNIKSNVPGLSFINKLNPVTYNLDIHTQNQMMYGNKKDAGADWDGKYDIEKVTQTGFLAQEVADAAKAVNYDFNGVDIPKNANDLYSLRYSEFVVPLVKAVQEQQQIIETEKDKNLKLETELQSLKQNQKLLEDRLKAIEQKLGSN